MSQIPKKRVYFGEKVGSGTNKIVFAGSETNNNIDLGVPKHILHAKEISVAEQSQIVFEHETPEKTVISCVFPEDETEYNSIINEIETQNVFSSKDLAPKIYNIIVEVETTYYKDVFPVYDKDKPTRIFILQERCVSDMARYIETNVVKLYRDPRYIWRKNTFFETTHDEIKTLIDNVLKFGMLLLDFKPQNICKTDNNSIALDLDTNFVVFFGIVISDELKKNQDSDKAKAKIIDMYKQMIQRGKVFMFVQYYITLTDSLNIKNPYYGTLLSRENIDASAIFNMFLFFDQYINIFFPSRVKNGVPIISHTPRSMLEHYLSVLENKKIKIIVPPHIPEKDPNWKKDYYKQLTKIICGHLDIPIHITPAPITLPTTTPTASSVANVSSVASAPTDTNNVNNNFTDADSNTFDRNIRARTNSPPPPGGGYPPPPGGGGYAGGKRKSRKSRKSRKKRDSTKNKYKK